MASQPSRSSLLRVSNRASPISSPWARTKRASSHAPTRRMATIASTTSARPEHAGQGRARVAAESPKGSRSARSRPARRRRRRRQRRAVMRAHQSVSSVRGSARRRSLPVLGSPSRSMISSSTSSGATGRCSTPFGTTRNSPGPSVRTPSRNSMVSAALQDQEQLVRLGMAVPDELALQLRRRAPHCRCSGRRCAGSSDRRRARACRRG